MSMRLALKVLNMIKDNYSFKVRNATIPIHTGIPITSQRWAYTNPYYSICPYSNGREQGFTIEVCRGWVGSSKQEDREDDLFIIFSEHRRSDELVVYHGLRRDFSHSSDMVANYIFDSDRRYNENQVSFSPRELDKAVDYIEKKLFQTFVQENEEVWKVDMEEMSNGKPNSALKKIFKRREELMTNTTFKSSYHASDMEENCQDIREYKMLNKVFKKIKAKEVKQK